MAGAVKSATGEAMVGALPTNVLPYKTLAILLTNFKTMQHLINEDISV